MGLLVGTAVSGMDVDMRVAVCGINVMVGSGTAISVGEATVTAGVHEVKMRAMSNAVLMFLTFIDTFFCNELPNGLRYAPSGYGWESEPTRQDQISRLNQAQNAEPTSRPAHSVS
jgi:hypothetical protein